MKLWIALYTVIWVVLAEFLLAMAPQGRPWVLYAHYILGVVVVVLALYTYRALRATTAPGRIKRIALVTFSMSIAMAVLGLPLLFHVGASWPVFTGVTVWNLLLFVHVMTAFGIITQMAAVAIAFDMWEDREFLQETRPGELPRPPGTPGSRTGGG